VPWWSFAGPGGLSGGATLLAASYCTRSAVGRDAYTPAGSCLVVASADLPTGLAFFADAGVAGLTFALAACALALVAALLAVRLRAGGRGELRAPLDGDECAALALAPRATRAYGAFAAASSAAAAVAAVATYASTVSAGLAADGAAPGAQAITLLTLGRTGLNHAFGPGVGLAAAGAALAAAAGCLIAAAPAHPLSPPLTLAPVLAPRQRDPQAAARKALGAAAAEGFGAPRSPPLTPPLRRAPAAALFAVGGSGFGVMVATGSRRASLASSSSGSSRRPSIAIAVGSLVSAVA
jgi:hypothetical protein